MMRTKKWWVITIALLIALMPSVADAHKHKGNHNKKSRIERFAFDSHKDKKKKKRKSSKKDAKGRGRGAARSRQQLMYDFNGYAPRRIVCGQNIASPLLNVVVPRGVSNQRINHDGKVVYFNNQYRIPNCVIYDFSATEAAQTDAPGAERRKNYKYNADPATNASPDRSDYRRSGYDRGHMAPAMDMKWSKGSMRDAFYMTNICPQNHILNSGPWRIVEETVHRWAKRDKRLIIASGPVLGNGMKMIGPKHNIAVPKAFYKIVYAPNQGRAIAFLFNNETARGSIWNHVVSVDYVERATGLSFLPGVHAAIKRKSNPDQWK